MKQTVHEINIKFNQNICQYIVKHKIKLRRNSLYKNLKQADSFLSTDINCWIQDCKFTPLDTFTSILQKAQNNIDKQFTSVCMKSK